jgi:hypothetical protein
LLSTSGNLRAGSYTQSTGALVGADAANYTLAPFTTATANYTVGQLALTGTAIAPVSTTYGTPAANGAVSFTNNIALDLVSSTASTDSPLLSTSGNLRAGSYTQSTGALVGADAANYTLAPFTTATANYTVGQLALTGTITSATTTYGQGLTPGAANLTNVVSGDIVTPVSTTVDTTGLLSGSNNLIAGTHVGIQRVSALGGADASNYTFASVVGDYTVNQLALTGAAIAAGGSVYASALAPGAVSFTNVVAGDIVTNTASVNTTTLSTSGRPIVGSYTQTTGALGGADAANYTLAGFTSAPNYTISPLALTGTAIAAGSSVYASALVPGAVSFTNVVGADIVTNTASVNTTTLSSSGNPIVGTYTQSTGVLGGADAGNYSLAPFTSAANYTISQLALTGAAIGASSSVYASALAPGAVSFTNVVGADIVNNTASVNTGATSSSGNFVAGTYTQSTGALSGADAANYTLAPFTSAANYTINQRALNVSATGVNKTYDTTTSATVTLSDNRVAGDVFSDSYASAAFADPNIGLAKPVNVSGISIAGADAGNYTSNTTAATTANITPPVSVNPTALAIPGSVLAFLYSGDDQLPPPTVGGPTGDWGQSPGMPSSLPGVQPDSRSASSESSGSEGNPEGRLSNQGAETIPNGAVRNLVTIVGGGVRMSSRQGGWLRQVNSR